MDNIFKKTINLVGEESFQNFKDKRIAIFGLGGVGGTAFESLLRSGFSNFVIFDFDIVDETNINRQILYTSNDIGKTKVDVAFERAKSINPNALIEKKNMRVSSENIKDLEGFSFDFVVDAIDDVDGKLTLYSFCLFHGIPFISCLGMGNRVDPKFVTISRLDKTENDPLAKKMRTECRHMGLDLKKINVVYSTESPCSKEAGVNSMMPVPSTAGLMISSYIISCYLFK